MHQNDGLTTVAEGLYFRTNMGRGGIRSVEEEIFEPMVYHEK